jgi:hypothetical protein
MPTLIMSISSGARLGSPRDRLSLLYQAMGGSIEDCYAGRGLTFY